MLFCERALQADLRPGFQFSAGAGSSSQLDIAAVCREMGTGQVCGWTRGTGYEPVASDGSCDMTRVSQFLNACSYQESCSVRNGVPVHMSQCTPGGRHPLPQARFSLPSASVGLD
eukprot:jgi/Ulvmu1/180/UM001_0184.1